MKQDNEIFVRVRKGNRVIEDMALSAAKANIHRGWKIEDLRYDELGRPINAEPNKPLEDLIVKEPEQKFVEIDLGLDTEPENVETDNSGVVDTIKKMRSKKKLQEIIDGDDPQELKEAAKERLTELNK